MLTSDDPVDLDFAEDAQQYQVSLRIMEVLRRNDCYSPFMIPEGFNLDDPSSISGPFINFLEEPTCVLEEKVFDWT